MPLWLYRLVGRVVEADFFCRHCVRHYALYW
jgi:hypothetical protein